MSSFIKMFEIGSLPVYRETWDFVATQRREQYEDLRRGVQFLFASPLPLKGQLTPEQMVQLSLVANGLSRWFHKVCSSWLSAVWLPGVKFENSQQVSSFWFVAAHRNNSGERTCLGSKP